MNNYVVPTSGRRYTDQQIRLMQNTVARGTTEDEFKQFIETAARYNLDPFKRQIHAVLFNANDPDRRQMAIVVGINGYRTLGYRAAQGLGFNVRPDSESVHFVIDEAAKDPELNPKGLVSATARLFVRHNPTDDWQPVIGQVDWDERAPIRFKKGGGQYLESAWKKMSKTMLGKCAEVDAWRKIVPDDLGGLYIEEEVAHAMIDITDQVERLDENERIEKTGGPGILVQWQPGLMLEKVPHGEFADRCFAHIAATSSLDDLEGWYNTNTNALREFWAHSKGDALEVKKVYEERIKDLKSGIPAEPEQNELDLDATDA